MTERAELLKGKPQRMSHLNLLQVGGTFCILSHVYTASMPEVRVTWIIWEFMRTVCGHAVYVTADKRKYVSLSSRNPYSATQWLWHETLLSCSSLTITALLSLSWGSPPLHSLSLSQTLQHLTNTHLLTLAFICCLRMISPAASSSKSRLIPCLLVCLYLHIHQFLTSSSSLIHFHPPQSRFCRWVWLLSFSVFTWSSAFVFFKWEKHNFWACWTIKVFRWLFISAVPFSPPFIYLPITHKQAGFQSVYL